MTRCALLAAIGGALLYFSSFFPTMSLTFTAVSGLASAAAVIHDSVGAGYAVYFATSALSALVVPDKGNVILYIAFFGLYPMLKSFAEKPKLAVQRWSLKLMYFNAVFTGAWIFGKTLLFDDLPDLPWLWLFAAAAANAAFVIYDIGLDRLISSYTYKIARKIDKRRDWHDK